MDLQEKNALHLGGVSLGDFIINVAKRVPLNIVLFCYRVSFIDFQDKSILCIVFHEHCIHGRRSRPLTPPSERCPTQK